MNGIDRGFEAGKKMGSIKGGGGVGMNAVCKAIVSPRRREVHDVGGETRGPHRRGGTVVGTKEVVGLKGRLAKKFHSSVINVSIRKIRGAVGEVGQEKLCLGKNAKDPGAGEGSTSFGPGAAASHHMGGK